jgi:hypothetical protein
MSANKYASNIHQKYVCDNCDYECSKKSCWSQHLLTSKHKRANLGLMQANKEYICEGCNIKFAHQSSYCRHKKKCKDVNVDSNEDKNDNIEDNETNSQDAGASDVKLLTNMVLEVVKQNQELMNQNQELQKHMIELCKNGTNNTLINNTNMTNSNNKAFNLNFFLNETCKDAMNIMDFVESIKLQLSDLEKVGELGYVEGISNIIVKNLNELDVTQRPVHCTDKKRETMYIKDEDKWEKDENNSKIKKAIKRVASKNQRLLPKFKEAHPDCGTYHSKYSDQYNKIIIESVGGSGDNDAEKEEKIIRNISKNVVVEK